MLMVLAFMGCAGRYEVEDDHVYVDLGVSKPGVCAVDDSGTLHCWGYTAGEGVRLHVQQVGGVRPGTRVRIPVDVVARHQNKRASSLKTP